VTGEFQLRHHTDPAAIQDILLDVYAEVYAAVIHEPFNTRERFAQRLDGHVTGLRWEAVVGYDAAEPVGYIYGCALAPGSKWWADLEPPVTDAEFTAETGQRTLAIFELMVRKPWRGTGAAHAIHEELVTTRPEQRSSLAVDHEHPRVRAMYERWGYRYVGAERPFPDAPLLDVMVRDLLWPARVEPEQDWAVEVLGCCDGPASPTQGRAM